MLSACWELYYGEYAFFFWGHWQSLGKVWAAMTVVEKKGQISGVPKYARMSLAQAVLSGLGHLAVCLPCVVFKHYPAHPHYVLGDCGCIPVSPTRRRRLCECQVLASRHREAREGLWTWTQAADLPCHGHSEDRTETDFSAAVVTW